MMDSATVIDLAHHFDSKLSNLQVAFDLSSEKNDASCQKLLSSIRSELEGLEIILAMMKSEVVKGRKAVLSVEDVNLVYQDLIEDLRYALDNIPSRLPNKTPSSNHSEPQTVTVKSATEDKAPASSKPVIKSLKEVSQTVEYLTVDEFETVPKYMRGRILYNQVNSMIDELNKAYKGKYKIMKMKKSTLNDANRKRHENFKLQETKDTKGIYFIVEADMKEFGHIKLDATARSMLTILRHCGRIREIRGGGLTRYAIVEMY